MLRTFIDTARAVKFLFEGPLIVLILFIINWFVSPGNWWFKWPAMGITIAWIISLFKVLRAVILAGGLAALIALLRKQQ